MKSKISIEYPFTDEYDCAYKVSSQGRNTIVLYKTGTGKRTSISYAKYLLSVHICRWITREEHVDHINNDRADDRVENLQIISLAENIQKQAAVVGCAMVEYECPVCGRIFSLKRKASHYGSKKGNKAVTCSRQCGGKSTSMNLPVSIIEIRQYNWYDEHHYTEQISGKAYFR